MVTTETKVVRVWSDAQAALLEHELLGQISDGHWENATPHSHYRAFAGVLVMVAAPGQPVGCCNVYLQRRYGFYSSELLAAVGPRMLSIARLAVRFGFPAVALMREALGVAGEYRGMPPYEGKYYDELRAQMGSLDLPLIRATVEDESLYTMRTLRRDLRELSKIVNDLRIGPDSC